MAFSRFALSVSLAGLAWAAPFAARADENSAPAGAASVGRDAAAEAEEVSVTGRRHVETGGSVHVVRDQQLRRFSYDDPHQVLLSVPGVYVRPEDGFGLRPNIGMRGVSSDRSKKITMMEDGVLVGPAPYSAPAAYYVPLIDRMRTIHVAKGPSSILFGPQTVGGAIDMITREIPSARAGSYNLAFGQYGFNKQHLTYGTSDDRAGFLIEGMRLDNSGFKTIDGGADTGFTRNEWMLKAFYLLDPTACVQNNVEIKVGYSSEGSNETYLGTSDADARRDPDRRYLASKSDRMDWHRTAIAVTHTATFSPRLEMKTTVYRHDLSRTWRKVNGFRGTDIADVLANPDTPRNQLYIGVLRGDVDSQTAADAILIGPNRRTFVSQGLQTRVHARVTTGPVKHDVTYGVRAHYDQIVRLHTQDAFAMRGRQLAPEGGPTETTADNEASTHALATWVTDAMTLGPVTLTPGVRVEAIHASARDALSGKRDGATYRVVVPGASAYWGVTPNVGVLAGVHRGFSPVAPEQARVARPESSVNYEAGGRFTARHARVEVIGFYNDYSNITNVCTFSNGCVGRDVDRQTDGGRARVGGAEIYGETELEVGAGFRVPSRLAYTYTYTEFLSTFNSADPQFGNVRSGDEIPYVPPHQISGSVGLERGAWGMNVAGTYVDSMRERAGQGAAPPGSLTDAYFLLDASARYRVIKALELYVNGRNLTNDRYVASRRPFGARPGAPTWIMVGARGEF